MSCCEREGFDKWLVLGAFVAIGLVLLYSALTT